MKNIIKVLLVVMALVLVVSAFVACEQDTTPGCEHKNKEFVLGQGATCTEDGLTSGYKCKDCGAWTTPQKLDPAGHLFIVEVKGVAATCEEDGYTAHLKCNRCDAVDGKEVIPAKGHNMQEVAAKDPTCTEAGHNKHQACANGCGKTEGKEEIKALGHTAGAAATCTTAQTCTVCKAELAPATGHTAGAAATCTTAQKCTVCNAEIAPATGHTAGAAATCTTAQKCTVCNTVLVAALGHDYVSGDCSRCNSIITYVINSAKWATVSAHMWGGSAADTKWPGLTMKKTGETVNGFDVYSVETTGGYKSIIFNNSNNGSQTGNLTLQKGQYFYVKDGKWYASLDVVPELDPLATNHTLAGTFNSWNTTTHGFRFDKEGDTTSYVRLTLKANTSYQFKVLLDGAWNGGSGNVQTGINLSSGGGDISFKSVCAGTYTFALTGKTIKVIFPDHKEVVLEGKDATCTENGLTEGKKCSACNTILVKQEVIPAGHKLGEDGVCEVCHNVPVSTADELIEALEAGKNVILMNDIVIDPANMSNAYGTTGLNIKKGQSLDGNGFVLDIHGAGGTWDSGVNTTGGVIKNIKVTGAFRGVFVNHTSDHSEQVVLENVVIEGTTYTISCDQGMQQTLKAVGSTFNGWTSYAATLGSAEFVDCKFGEGNGYAYCRPYSETTFTNCVFEEGYEIDATCTTLTFVNCYVGETLVTAENVVELLGEGAASIVFANN